jgi:Flp pilus assembly protein TadG
MSCSTGQHRPAKGQALVLFALLLTGILLGTALVVDVGNAWAQERVTQNAADSSAEAGAVVIVQYLAGSTVPPTGGGCPISPLPSNQWDLAVCDAVYGNAQAAGVTLTAAKYTDYAGNLIGDIGAGFPSGAQGVRTYGSRTFETSFARVIGMNAMTVNAQATAVSGAITSYCPPGTACGVLPLTIPYVVSLCNDSGKMTVGDSSWPLLGSSQANASNEVTVPICKNQNGDIGGGSAGSVGFIDFTTIVPTSAAHQTGQCQGGNSANAITSQITNGCFTNLSFPAWVKTIPGGVSKGGPNGPQAAIDALHGQVVLLPLFDFACKDQPTGPNKSDCDTYPTPTGAGDNTWYHITTFANFLVDQAFLAGSAKKDCGGTKNGSDACLTGWFVKALTTPGTLQLGPVAPNTNQPLGVELIK